MEGFWLARMTVVLRKMMSSVKLYPLLVYGEKNRLSKRIKSGGEVRREVQATFRAEEMQNKST